MRWIEARQELPQANEKRIPKNSNTASNGANGGRFSGIKHTKNRTTPWQVATATVATPATLELSGVETVATVASGPVASAGKEESGSKGLAPIVEGLHPCILCDGNVFNEGSRGGYFCVECQTLPEGASVNRVVRGNTPRKA